MFGKILGKKKEETQEDSSHQIIVEKIAKMNISDMRFYVNNKLSDFEVCEDGLNEVMRRLNSQDADEKRFIEMDAMDSKKKKAFDLVILISKNKKVTIVVTELMQEFMENYKDILTKFDKDNKQIYTSLLKDALTAAITTISTMAEINRKTTVLGS